MNVYFLWRAMPSRPRWAMKLTTTTPAEQAAQKLETPFAVRSRQRSNSVSNCNAIPPLVRRQVEQLLESGLVAGQGQGRGRAYTLSHRVYAAFDREDAYQHQAILTPEEIDQRILDLAGSLKILRRKDVMEALGGLDERQASYALQR
jgi:hypothetical protein